MPDFDVVVVGGGGSGIAAAIEALDNGASVLLCEKGQRIGGSTANSGGVLMAAGSDLQRERGIEDSVDDLFEHYMTHNKYQVEPGLARTLCEGGQPTLDWLRSHGVTFDSANIYITGVENPKAPRGHPADGNGHAIMVALENAAMSRGLEVALKTRVEHLLRDEDGRVCGIRADGQDITAGAVVLATGGFSASFEMLERYFPLAARHGKEWHFAVGIDENVGDGLVMGQEIGAALVGHGLGNALPTASFSKEPEAYIPNWLVYVNNLGARFINEAAPYAIKDYVLNQQPDGRCWALMDHAAFMRDEKDPKYTTAQFLIFETPNWMPGALSRHLANGYIHKGDSWEEVAKLAGIAPDALAATVAEYNAHAESGRDPHYLKGADYLIPMTEGPFYAIEMRAAGIGTTHTGLRINPEAEVYSENGSTIPGLYAAGECSGGVMAHYVGGGNSLLNNFVFGRIAGRNAAATAKRHHNADNAAVA